MSVICPTVLAAEPHEYREQMERIVGFAERIQIDLSDGEFTPSRTVGLDEVWWNDGSIVDVHLMYRRPYEAIETLIKLKPSLVIVHAEADGSFFDVAERLRPHGIRTGVALLKETDPKIIRPALEVIDHVLVFSGELGSFGGQADLELLDKVRVVKEWKPGIETGWDGGINDKNAWALIDSGVDVLNVGGYIQSSSDPRAAYDTLKTLVENKDGEKTDA